MKKEIKSQYPELNISIIDALAEVDPSKTNKYLPFLINLTLKELKEKEKYINEYKASGSSFGLETKDMPITKLFLLEGLLRNVIEREHVTILQKFNELLEMNRIEERDVLKYKTLDDFKAAITESFIKYETKEREKEIIKVLDNEKYLAIRPLTYEASIKYGYGTKWCTAAVTSQVQWDEYYRNSILCYVINKETKDKSAICIWINWEGEFGDTTIWNSADKRIDSTESVMDSETYKNLLTILKTEAKSNWKIAKEKGLETETTLFEIKTSINGLTGVPDVVDTVAPPINEIQNATNELTELAQGLESFLSTESDPEPQPKSDRLPVEFLSDSKESTFKKILNNIISFIKPRKNIIVFLGHGIEEEQLIQIKKQYEKTNLSKTHELTFFLPNR